MAKIVKRTKKDGSCSYCIRVSNGYDRLGRQVMVNRTFTPPPGMTGKKLEKELKRQADAFEQEVHSGISLDASMKMDDLIERWFTEYAEKKLKAKTVYNYRRLVPRISAGLGQLKVCQVKPSHLMAFYSNLEEQGVREDSRLPCWNVCPMASGARSPRLRASETIPCGTCTGAQT